MKDEDFGKPIIAVVNSFTQFVPGHVHLKDLGQLVAREIEKAGGVAKEFNTIAVDDGIAMGHDGMLYSLPSRELIADSVEYMVNAHCADAMVCISNCDKITPGMLMAALRLNIPTCSSPAGRWRPARSTQGQDSALDLIDAMVAAADDNVSDAEVEGDRALGLPDLRLLLGHVHRQFDELPDRGAGPVAARQRLGARDPCRPQAPVRRGRPSDRRSGARYYEQDDETVLPRKIASFKAFENAMTLDIAMGGSTNTVLHLLAAAYEGGGPFTMQDIDRLSRRVPCSARSRRRCRRAHGRRAPRRRHHGHPRRARPRRPAQPRLPTVHSPTLAMRSTAGTSSAPTRERPQLLHGRARRRADAGRVQPGAPLRRARYSTRDGLHPRRRARLLEGRRPRVLSGNIALDGCIVKTAGVDESILKFDRPGAVFESQDAAVEGHPGQQGQGRRRRRGPL
jgi:dihydroxy-acid dehydratase